MYNSEVLNLSGQGYLIFYFSRGTFREGDVRGATFLLAAYKRMSARLLASLQQWVNASSTSVGWKTSVSEVG